MMLRGEVARGKWKGQLRYSRRVKERAMGVLLAVVSC